jgi:hypothetical protein
MTGRFDPQPPQIISNSAEIPFPERTCQMNRMDGYASRQLAQPNGFPKLIVKNLGCSVKPIMSLRSYPDFTLPENFSQKFHRQALNRKSRPWITTGDFLVKS